MSTEPGRRPAGFITLPAYSALPAHRQRIVEELPGGPAAHRPWSHANRIAEGQADVCVWFRGDIGITPRPRFSRKPADDSATTGSRRLDIRTAIYSNGVGHDEVLAAFVPS